MARGALGGDAKQKRNTPSALRKRKNQQRSRKSLQHKMKDKKPSWTAAMKKSYIKDDRKKKSDAAKEGDAEEEEGGYEVQEEIDEATQERLNKAQPLQAQLFIKGVPPDATDGELFELFKRFGKVKRVLLVQNKVTKRPAGTGFVHFDKPDVVEKVLAHAQQNAREAQTEAREKVEQMTQALSHHKAKKLKYKLNNQEQQQPVSKDPFIMYNNHKIFLFRAMSRIDSQELVSQVKKKKNRTKVAGDDPRNLYLLQEGMILPGTPAAVGLPPQYLEMLQSDYESRKQQLRNTTMFVSRTRLSIRNFPRKLEEKDLRTLCSKYAREYLKKHPEDLDRESWGKYGPIKNVKLLVDPSGISRGYGFAEFVNHNVALHVLRSLNNNPTLYGPRQRLVVNFAIENINALQKLERIREKKRTRLQSTHDE